MQSQAMKDSLNKGIIFFFFKTLHSCSLLKVRSQGTKLLLSRPIPCACVPGETPGSRFRADRWTSHFNTWHFSFWEHLVRFPYPVGEGTNSASTEVKESYRTNKKVAYSSWRWPPNPGSFHSTMWPQRGTIRSVPEEKNSYMKAVQRIYRPKRERGYSQGTFLTSCGNDQIN